jgi:outer membrane protein OmpA-like peptidoglycan-associated protein
MPGGRSGGALMEEPMSFGKHPLKCIAMALAVAAGGALAPSAGAQERLTNSAGRPPTPLAVMEARRPPAGARTRTRAINLAPMLAAADAAAAPQVAAAKVSLDRIHFEFDSSRLTPDATRLLERVGQALGSSELAGLAFVVEGHTDAQGDEAYNQALSVRRAQAVKEYLVAQHGIPAARLKAVGKGETDLVDVADPEGSANRRVVFMSLVGAR